MGIEGLFWFSAFVIGYTYLGYPLLLAAWARLGARAAHKADLDALRTWPAISIVIAARNEAVRLPGRIANLLQLDYRGPCEIIVVSDGSTDGTAEALAPYDGLVRLIEVPAGGKPLALNAGVAASLGDIVVFADARQQFSPNALLDLVANFADPTIGGVTGELVLEHEAGAGDSTIGEGVGLYWTYEKWIRRNESRVWSTLGATGAIYAIRRALWQPLPAETLLDDVLMPMRVVLAGHRVVFDERARAYDRASADAAVETRRKTRTLAGNYQILGQEPKLLIPIVNPVWLQYVSHKIARLIVPWALLIAFVTSLLLAPSHWFFGLALVAQLGFYSLAIGGAALDARHRRDGERKFSSAVPATLER